MFKIEQLENESENEYQDRRNDFFKEIKTFKEEKPLDIYLEFHNEKDIHTIVKYWICSKEDIKNENSYLYKHQNRYMENYDVKVNDVIRQEANAGYLLEPVSIEEYNKQKWVSYDMVDKYKLKFYVYLNQK